MFTNEMKNICNSFGIEYNKNHEKIDKNAIIYVITTTYDKKLLKYLKNFIHTKIPFFENNISNIYQLDLLLELKYKIDFENIREIHLDFIKNYLKRLDNNKYKFIDFYDYEHVVKIFIKDFSY